MSYKNILLIVDDDDDQELFIMALKKIKGTASDCHVYNNALEALQSLIDRKSLPDAIFLDLNMPVMNGQQFLMEIKKHGRLKEIPVIIFSTSKHVATIQLTMELGANDFITKPNNFDELVRVLGPIVT